MRERKRERQKKERESQRKKRNRLIFSLMKVITEQNFFVLPSFHLRRRVSHSPEMSFFFFRTKKRGGWNESLFHMNFPLSSRMFAQKKSKDFLSPKKATTTSNCFLVSWAEIIECSITRSLMVSGNKHRALWPLLAQIGAFALGKLQKKAKVSA